MQLAPSTAVLAQSASKLKLDFRPLGAEQQTGLHLLALTPVLHW